MEDQKVCLSHQEMEASSPRFIPPILTHPPHLSSSRTSNRDTLHAFTGQDAVVHNLSCCHANDESWVCVCVCV